MHRAQITHQIKKITRGKVTTFYIHALQERTF